MIIQSLYDAVSFKRGHDSRTEAQYCARLLTQLIPMGELVWLDPMGNFALQVGKPSRTLFVAHTDTVHSGEGINLSYEKDGFLYAQGDALGADDGAGIALLTHMMHKGVAGTYLFCRGEECGGIGSSYIAEMHEGWLRQFDRAIQFDRRGTADVITHQGGQRCASDEFGLALATALSEANEHLLYAPSDRGVFTDTANFVSIIPECTNISCGYANEHGSMECQDLHHLERLGEAVLLVGWEALPTKRDPDADLCWGRGVRRSTRADDGLFMTGWPPESKLGDGFADEEYGFWAALQSARAGTLDDLGFLIKEWVGHEVIDMDAIAYHHLDTIDDTGMSAWEALDYLAVVATGAAHE